MKHDRRYRYWPTRLMLVLLLAAGLTACETVGYFLVHAGGETLVWPKPPSAARLYYEESFDLFHGPPPVVNAFTGQEMTPSLQMLPKQIASRHSVIVTIERNSGMVQVYDRTTNESHILRGQTGQILKAVSDAVIDDFGRIYVAESIGPAISYYEANGRLIRRFGYSKVFQRPQKPAKLALDILRGRLYVADTFLERMFVFTLGGSLLHEFGEGPGRFSQFDGLSDITVDHDGNLWVLEALNRKLLHIRPDGSKIRAIKLDPAVFIKPISVTIDSDDILYIADSYREMIAVMDASGKLITRIGQLGREPGSFNGLSDVDFNPDTNRLYTAELGFPRIQVFRRTETPWLPYP